MPEGLDTKTDPKRDAKKDAYNDKADGNDVGDVNDPSFTDTDKNARDWTPPWAGGDNDPNKIDTTTNPANRANTANPKLPNTRDDDDGVNTVKPDTTADSIT